MDTNIVAHYFNTHSLESKLDAADTLSCFYLNSFKTHQYQKLFKFDIVIKTGRDHNILLIAV